ncbi:Protein of uncharacterised function (DUF3854) [Mycobacteroides abscessus subsp. abscessus]|uniref:DUF3854 domain-containing protein n=1 Tax=Mycobacteroides abscessus TaxID=36809 RepID=UPI0009A77DAF|nr:DUF3854 domain-containing protein [Mycobacteroides abscessus]SKR18911.1 Protein of uncharacterised function (DUF3854) [Mycobacteroides abscessus subsp. abscessus]
MALPDDIEIPATGLPGRPLIPEHFKYLAESGISPEYLQKTALIRSTETLSDLPDYFRERADVLLPKGILFGWRNARGFLEWQVRLDKPPVDEQTGKPKKYLFHWATAIRYGLINERSGNTVLIVEGTKQGHAVTSAVGADVTVLAIPGCSGWARDGWQVPNDMVRLTEAKSVFVCLDADAASNLDVYTAGEKLSEGLSPTAASVRFIQVPGENKSGIDDHLATIAVEGREAELERLMTEALAAPAAAKPSRTVVGDPYAKDLEDKVFGASPLLDQLRQHARSLRCGPWAVLGFTLGRTALAVPPHVQLPPVVCAPASLNLILGIVGTSGQGKGGAVYASSGIRFYTEPPAPPAPIGTTPDTRSFGPTPSHEVVTPTPASVGSGEAIASLFVSREKVENPIDGKAEWIMAQHTVASWIHWDEVDTLTGQKGRQGSTLDAELRKLYSGEGLGNVTKTNCIYCDPHIYRAVASMSIQPGRAAGLYGDEFGGLIQRLLHFGAGDPHAPEQRGPQTPPFEAVVLPDFKGSGMVTVSGAMPKFIRVAPAVAEKIDRDRQAALTGMSDDDDPLDRHLGLTRLKISALAAILHGEGLTVSEQWWQWSGEVIEHSRRVRDGIRTGLATQAREAAQARGRMTHVMNEAAESAAGKDHDRALAWLRAWAEKREVFTLREAQQSTKSGTYTRRNLKTLIKELAEVGELRQAKDGTFSTVEPDRTLRAV